MNHTRKKSIRRFFQKSALTLTVTATILFGATAVLNRTLPNVYEIGGDHTALSQSIFPISAYQRNETDAEWRLFGVIPVKRAQVAQTGQPYVRPMGTPFGIKIFTDGVIVVGMTDVQTQDGLINPAKKAGIAIGDILLTLNGTKLTSNEHLSELLQESQGKTVTLQTTRNGQSRVVQLTPIVSKEDRRYKAGMWVRDSSAGIGTMTFQMPECGVYGGLGHPICDADTGEILSLSKGSIVGADIQSCLPSNPGQTGELCGVFDESKQLGTLSENIEIGVYGFLNQKGSQTGLVPVASPNEVKPGPAVVLTTIDESGPRSYECVIEKVIPPSNDSVENLVIRITDPVLLEKTGGIVQGMSGSPIIQNGKLVGAVTHVFIQEPQRGYGIFAKTMVDEATRISQEQRKAS